MLRQWGSRGVADGRFHAPAGVAIDAAGDVFALDGENNRVQVFDADRALHGQVGPARHRAGRLLQPSAIAVDCAGNVYVADTNNNRVERFNPVDPKAAGCLAPGAWPPPLDVAPVLRVGAAATAAACSRGAR